jgi:chaperonin GroES
VGVTVVNDTRAPEAHVRTDRVSSAGRLRGMSAPDPVTEIRRSVAVLGDRVLVAPPDEAERRTKAGILIPATAKSVDRKGIWGQAIGVGPHVRSIQTGDDVLYLPEDAIEVDVQGEPYLIVRERDIHAVGSTRRDGATGLYL